MSVLKLNEKFVQEGKSKALEGTARRASEGREMMEIEKGGHPLINQAVRNASDNKKPINIAFIP
ncbi:DUF6470 family protein [Oceanobacillus senegalensis]|uniref:DUF6470 family protein n=1 Tax=Oceanobacillus senegalensis TaxID=1936063 RepID=UPI001C4FEBA8|nr:DUF6470 family protein [Oceanobacillus senegalensis]